MKNNSQPLRTETNDILYEAWEQLAKKGLTEGQISDRLGNVITAALPEMGNQFLRAMKKTATAHLEHCFVQRGGFLRRLRRTWGKPFDLFRLLIEASREAGADQFVVLGQASIDANDLVFEVLCRLHARACLVAEEVLWLMEGGLASGAMARWRTLHEIAVVGHFISEHGQEVAEQYLLHHHIESHRAAVQYQQHCKKLGKRRLTVRDMKKHQQAHDDLVNRFGKPYRTDWGWAAATLKKDRPNFMDIEEAVSLSYIRPYFRFACYPNHAGCKGIMFDLGNRSEDFGLGEMFLAGPSDAGFFDPGFCGAKHLVQSTATFLLHNMPSLENLAVVWALQQLADEVVSALANSEHKLEMLATSRQNAPTRMRKRDDNKIRAGKRRSKKK